VKRIAIEIAAVIEAEIAQAAIEISPYMHRSV